MRALILAGVLGVALPAFATDDPVPTTEATTQATTTEATAAEAAAPSSMPSRDEGPAGEPGLAEAMPEPEPARPPVPADAVARATFATAVDHREPVDSITTLGSDRDRVFYFSEFVGVSGRELTHRWKYRGEVVAEVPIAIGGPRWRAYSSKGLDPSQLGEWTVSVIDESGAVVHEDSFVYEEAAPAAELTATPAPAEPGASNTELSEEAPAEAPASPAPAQP